MPPIIHSQEGVNARRLDTGTLHPLVIAGLHLGILAGFAGMVLRRLLPWRWGLPAVAAFTILYMLLVDAQPPVVRATVLIVAACGAVYFGRRRVSFNVLALAGLIVLAINPVDLFNVGPQLSFLCVAGLMALAPSWMVARGSDLPDDLQPPVKSRLVGRTLVRLSYWLPRWMLPERQPREIEKLLEQERPWAFRMIWLLGRGLRRLTLVSGAIWLLTLPLVMARFHIFNPIAVLINTAVWLPMAGALVSGLALLLCSMVPGPLASVCAVACNGQLAAVEWRAVAAAADRYFFLLLGPASAPRSANATAHPVKQTCAPSAHKNAPFAQVLDNRATCICYSADDSVRRPLVASIPRRVHRFALSA